jgi:hypothetical protein
LVNILKVFISFEEPDKGQEAVWMARRKADPDRFFIVSDKGKNQEAKNHGDEKNNSDRQWQSLER